MFIISIQNEQTGQEVWRRYDWSMDSDFEAKGEAVEDMMDTLTPPQKVHTTHGVTNNYSDALQVDDNQPI